MRRVGGRLGNCREPIVKEFNTHEDPIGCSRHCRPGLRACAKCCACGRDRDELLTRWAHRHRIDRPCRCPVPEAMGFRDPASHRQRTRRLVLAHLWRRCLRTILDQRSGALGPDRRSRVPSSPQHQRRRQLLRLGLDDRPLRIVRMRCAGNASATGTNPSTGARSASSSGTSAYRAGDSRSSTGASPDTSAWTASCTSIATVHLRVPHRVATGHPATTTGASRHIGSRRRSS
jgi:hypothetical protein